MSQRSHVRLVLGCLSSLLAACAAEPNPAPPTMLAPAPVAAAPTAQVPAPSAAAAAQAAVTAQEDAEAAVRALYDKREVLIPMRDGVRLHTAIYTPKAKGEPFALLLRRTPYSCRPYGADEFPARPGPSEHFTGGPWGFVIQDVRGCYLSEGEFVDVRPHRAAKGPSDVDESTDTWDTIEWLVKNVPGHNGKVGMWGISYPGFYAAAGMIDAHPALAAVSPQAPIADWWWDDFHHHGALFLPHAFLFMASFGRPRPVPVTERSGRIETGTPDGWRYFLELGPLADAGERHLDGEVRFWEDLMDHPNRDAFWVERDLRPHLNRVAPAVMCVGGWFDAEDLFGPLAIYRSVEERNPGISNAIVMGPWSHGGWARADGASLGQARFGEKTAEFYRQEVELRFFEQHLLGQGDSGLPEALMFETGANRWRRFDAWPPSGVVERRLVLADGGALELAQDAQPGATFDEFVSDPAKPVPHSAAIVIGMNTEYMVEDQRFAARRPDVLVYETEPLEEDVTLAGPIVAELSVSTTGTDADWIVKLVDVFPSDAEDPEDLAPGQRMGGYHMLVRGEVMPGRFRESYEKPVPFEPGQPTLVRFELWDVLHTFQRGHRIQVQVQSTWFPLVARNPQTFLENPYEAREADHRAATHRLMHGSSLRVGVLPAQ
jgi:putative CocE/NonD family hydrolase